MNDPWPQSLRDTRVNEYGQGLEYGQGYVYSDYAMAFSAPGSMVVRNEGSLSQAPIIRIRGVFTNLTLSDGVSTLTLSGSSATTDVWEINCEKYSVKLNGTNAYGRSNGVFFTLKPGNTAFSVSGSGINLSLAFEFRYKYLY
ncbi:Phage tail protein [compost metagenome]